MSYGRITAEMSVDEALLIEFDDRAATSSPEPSRLDSVQDRMDMVWNPRVESHLHTMQTAGKTTITAALNGMSMTTAPGRLAQPASYQPFPSSDSSISVDSDASSVFVPNGPVPELTEQQLAEYSQYPKDHPIDLLPVSVNSGWGLCALYGDEKTPRTIQQILIEDRNANGVQFATAYLPARLTLAEICAQYPQYVCGTLLRMFVREGWTAEDIWNNLPDGISSQTADESVPWYNIQQAIDQEIAYMVANEDYSNVNKTPREVILPQGGQPAVVRTEFKPYRLWTPAEIATLYELYAQNNTPEEMGDILDRKPTACVSKMAQLRKKARAQAAADAADQSSSPSPPPPTPTMPRHYGLGAAGQIPFNQMSFNPPWAQANPLTPANPLPQARRPNPLVAPSGLGTGKTSKYDVLPPPRTQARRSTLAATASVPTDFERQAARAAETALSFAPVKNLPARATSVAAEEIELSQGSPRRSTVNQFRIRHAQPLPRSRSSISPQQSDRTVTDTDIDVTGETTEEEDWKDGEEGEKARATQDARESTVVGSTDYDGEMRVGESEDDPM
jgi:hypothetical protein